MKIWFNDAFDDDARARDLMRFSQIVSTRKSDITNHLADILGKCSRHPEYYQAAKCDLVEYAKKNSVVKASFEVIIKGNHRLLHIIPLAKEILNTANEQLKHSESGCGLKSKL